MLKREIFQIVSDALGRDSRINPEHVEMVGDSIMIFDKDGHNVTVEVKNDGTCHGILNYQSKGES